MSRKISSVDVLWYNWRKKQKPLLGNNVVCVQFHRPHLQLNYLHVVQILRKGIRHSSRLDQQMRLKMIHHTNRRTRSSCRSRSLAANERRLLLILSQWWIIPDHPRIWRLFQAQWNCDVIVICIISAYSPDRPLRDAKTHLLLFQLTRFVYFIPSALELRSGTRFSWSLGRWVCIWKRIRLILPFGCDSP